MKKALIIVFLCVATLAATASIYIFGEPVNFCPKCGKPYNNAPDTIPVTGGHKLMYICNYCGAQETCVIDYEHVLKDEDSQE